MPSEQLKFTYFDLRARGEPVRMVLEVAGVPYEDIRLPYETWHQQKIWHKPFHHLPYMEYKGKKYGGLYGKSNLDALRINEVVETCADFITDIYEHTFCVTDDSQRARLREVLLKDVIPMYENYLIRLLQENGSCGHFVGNELTLADLYTYNILDAVLVEDKEAVKSWHKDLRKLRKTVESHPKIHRYIQSRPAVKF
ncbi:S-crystallin SL11-like [Babylonia areolata]|uniref:S-crystallin SL11-like n=1 Tax=Babylonia areolata TaxID=304850 RepID=UPI003FD2F1B0